MKKKKHNWIPITFFFAMLLIPTVIMYDPEEAARQRELEKKYEAMLTPTPVPTNTPTPIGWVKPTATPTPEGWVSPTMRNSTILVNVGLSDFEETNTVYNGKMKVVLGKTNDYHRLSVTVTYEDSAIINIMLSNGIRSVDLYSDTKGGYLGKYDSKTGYVTHYASGGVVENWK